MADNTQVVGSGDVIRDIDRGSAKTQVVALDAGGNNGESLVCLNNPLPVYSPWVLVGASVALRQLQLATSQPSNGFVPLEIPAFLGAF